MLVKIKREKENYRQDVKLGNKANTFHICVLAESDKRMRNVRKARKYVKTCLRR